jgi:acetoin utilization deacetylase AcuC-like enzyme
MRKVGLVIDSTFERHDTGPGHPERSARLASVKKGLNRSKRARACLPAGLERADDSLLTLVHDPGYVEHVEKTCASGARLLDSDDTTICSDSADVARLAAGSLAALCGRVAEGELERGFAAIRPPGHHAEANLAMGFCLFNNVAVAARHLQAAHSLSKVLIVDWDVHHGNGTQHLFEEDPSIFYFSVHQSPLYPGTGGRGERGRGAGLGSTLNCPLPPGSGDELFIGALRDELMPAAESFGPEFVLVSAGFDAHMDDPLGGLEVSTEAYAQATKIVAELADRCAEGRLVSVLEGGYDLDALAASVVTHLERLAA